MDCIFCEIGAGTGPAERLLETERVLAFLDIAPVNYGHTLVIPKDHYATFLELPDDVWMEMGQVSRWVAEALRKVLYAQGFNLGMNNFEAAGQVVFHAHLHVIPRYSTDGLHFFPQGVYHGKDRETTATQIREFLSRL